MKNYLSLLFFIGLSYSVFSQQPRLMLPIGHTDAVNVCRVSKDGKKLITASDDQTVKIWDIESGVMLANLKEHKDGISQIILSPDGNRFISIDADNVAYLWNAVNGDLLFDFKNKEKNIYCLQAVFSDDGRKILTVGSGGIHIWDSQTFEKLNFIPVTATVLRAAWKNNDSILIDVYQGESGLCDIRQKGGSQWTKWNGSVREGDALKSENKTCITNWSIDRKQIIQIKGDRDIRFAIPGTTKARVYTAKAIGLQSYYLDSCWKNSKKGVPVRIPVPEQPVAALGKRHPGNFSMAGKSYFLLPPDHQRLIVGNDSSLYVFRFYPDPDQGPDRLYFEKRIDLPVNEYDKIVFSDDGGKICVITYNGVFVYQLKGNEDNQVPYSYFDTGEGVNDFAFSPDGRKVFTATNGKVIHVWDTRSHNYLNSYDGKTFTTSAIDFSPDIKYMVTAGEEGTARIWDVNTGKILRVLAGHEDQINQAFFTKDGKTVVTASDDQTVILWDAATGKQLEKLTGHKGGVNNVAISPDEKVLVTVSDDSTALLWRKSAITGRWTRQKQLGGHDNSIFSVFFSGDGSLFFTLSTAPSVIQVWQTATGMLLKKIKYGKNREDALTTDLDNVSISRDGKRLIVSGTMQFSGDLTDNAKLRKYRGPQVWDIASGRLLNTFPVADASGLFMVNSQYSPATDRILSVSYDNYLGWVEDVVILNAQTGKVIHKISDPAWEYLRFINSLFSNDGQTVLLNFSTGYSVVVDVKTGKVKTWLRNPTDDLLYARFSPDNKYILGAPGDNTQDIWDAASGEKLYKFFSVDTTDDYLVLDKYNRYDGTQKARSALYFTCGTEVIQLEQFKSLCWEPGLVKKIMGLDKDSISAKKLTEISICNKTPLVNMVSSDSVQHHFRIQARDGGLGEAELFVNGKLIRKYLPKDLERKDNLYDLYVPDSVVHTFFVSGKQNIILVKATTAAGDMTSRGTPVRVASGLLKKKTPDMYIFSVGINRYKDSALHLNYAAGDAWSFAKALTSSAKKLLNTDNQNHVFTWVYNTDSSGVQGRPSKREISKGMDSLSKMMKSDDILIFFFAGHGVLKSGQKSFYLLTSDATKFDIEGVEKDVAISTDELNGWLQQIKANKQLLILDACNSGQAVKDLIVKRDVPADQVRALEDMKDKSGTFILSASASGQSAYESGTLGQGLLTYSLLSTIKNKDGLRQNLFLDVNNWFNAASGSVKNMARGIGERQEPQIISAATFDVGMVDMEVINGIKLGLRKKIVSKSLLYSGDPLIMADTLELSDALNRQLDNISAGSGSSFSYIENSKAPETYSVRGEYHLENGRWVANLRLVRNGKKIKEISAAVDADQLDLLVQKIADAVTAAMGAENGS